MFQEVMSIVSTAFALIRDSVLSIGFQSYKKRVNHNGNPIYIFNEHLADLQPCITCFEMMKEPSKFEETIRDRNQLEGVM